jgi:hypothetical protein
MTGKAEAKNTWAEKALVRLQCNSRVGRVNTLQNAKANSKCTLQNGDAVCGAGRGKRAEKKKKKRKKRLQGTITPGRIFSCHRMFFPLFFPRKYVPNLGR